MDLQQLRYVVEIADRGSFTRAAAACFVTQSALSHQLASLERELGHRLFVRTSRSVRLTEPGEGFVRHARRALQEIQHATDAVAAVAGEVRGTLRLGMIPTVTAVDVPDLLRRFSEAHPHTRVELKVGNSDALMPAIRAGELDLAFLGLRDGVTPTGMTTQQLAREALVAALPVTHRFASRRRLTLADLAGDAFADFPAGTSGRAQSDTAFAAAQLVRDVAYESETAELILRLVAAGLAVSLLPARVVEEASEVVTVPVSDSPVRVEYAVWDQHEPRAVARAFAVLLEGELRQ